MIDNDELYDKLVCALLHNIDTCGNCMKCNGNTAIEIRMNLLREVAKYMNKELPWRED